MPYTPVSLSGAANGGVIVLAATSFTLPSLPAAQISGTTIHQAVAGTEVWDELWLWATNGNASSQNLSIGWGAQPGVAFGTNLCVHSLILTTGETRAVVEGLRIQNSLMVAGISSVANAIKISGYVNRITPDE